MNDRPLLKRRQRAPWAFRALLCLFPVDFTREFGEEMAREFRISIAEAVGWKQWVVVWRRALWDLAVSVPREHWDTWMGPDGGIGRWVEF